MSQVRKLRAEKRADQENPQNVTIIEAGLRKVISWDEYLVYLEEEKLRRGEVI